MSEHFENLRKLKYLSIFPLPIVLLPNELLPLHIFELRYQKMLGDVQSEDNLFGLSYFNPEKSIDSIPKIGSVGCVARVEDFSPLGDGRSNILSIGIVRYRLEGFIDTDEPYLIGEITIFEDFEEDLELLQTVADEVFELFKRVAKAAHELSGAHGTIPEIPQTDPQMLSFLISAAFNLDLQLKYEFIEMRSTIRRLERLKEIINKSIKKIEVSAEINKVAKTNGHNKNKIDLDF